MNIEIVDFYLIKSKKPKSNFIGTLHVYVYYQDDKGKNIIGFDVRGIPVHRKGEFVNFKMPYYTGTDDSTGKPCKYPVFNYTEPSAQKQFIDLLLKHAKPYILEIHKVNS